MTRNISSFKKLSRKVKLYIFYIYQPSQNHILRVLRRIEEIFIGTLLDFRKKKEQ